MGAVLLAADRVRVPELMDDPSLDAHQHASALRGLARLNAISGSTGIVWQPILRLAPRLGRSRLSLLDIASGAGDLPIALARRAARAGLTLDITAVDRSSTAIAHAQRQAEACGTAIAFQTLDALADPLPGRFDVVACSLFFHHLDESDAVRLLAAMAGAARHLVLVNDLRRGSEGLGLAWLASRALTRSKVVHIDAVRSARSAFTPDEMKDLAREAGLRNARVSRRWPFRFLLQWERT